MKIGIDALAVDNRSGSGIYTCELLAMLARIDRRNEYYIFVPHRFNALPDSLCAENFHLHPVRLLHPGLRPLWVQTVLPLRAKSLRLDVLHSTQFSAPVRSPVPLVVTMHDVIYKMFPETLRRSRLAYYRFIVPKVAQRCKYLITDSQGAKNDIVRELKIDPSKVKAIPLAASEEFNNTISEEQTQRVRETYSLPEQYILSVGTLEPRKNLSTLIDAFMKIAQDFPSTNLVIAGRAGWGYEKLFPDEQSNHSFRDRIQFLGFVPKADLPVIYRLASVFAFPSLYEGFGLPLLEAMMSGTPVVASGIPTSLELLKTEGTGLVVEPKDVQGWAQAMEDVLRDKELSSCLAANGKQAASVYSWERTAESTLAVYEAASEK